MVTRIGTKQRKTRHKLSQPYRKKGKISIRQYFQEFAVGDKANLKIHPSVQKGRFFPRFHGLTGNITGKMKGQCYEVIIKDGGKTKALFIHPIHLKK
ncbi:50S ribosomal protein L21e [Candidatus Woesearchaeota archaeon]|jgi:large subunit ribosomal protein L21e|nr:50S ribosomal protein L21e [Candidatus Woesearchaeota archaeon]MBT4151357.1 50S ribosomal protein L21e [Candidatus Woesearchaeota archaeon]MBT4247755.1 50S ribosomal protein L21e [Candidatus Woesearchaeota archaeon]MBT4434179.1 50S ribosomal protein L21e [Candidatus Woesearchaeota archaeon]MBT7332351.1 50S ribosomal protein L21e [Candidatus Woesearchaeota archaeon]